MQLPLDQAEALDAIRREIDAVDDALLRLLGQRFAAVAKVRDIKAGNGSIGLSALRPAREAAILRRLAEATPADMPVSLTVRLWRAIIAAATLQQAPLGVHASAASCNSGDMRVMLAERFGEAPLHPHAGEAAALEALGSRPADVAVAGLDSDWARSFAEGRAGRARVIGVLPDIAAGGPPKALIFGHALAGATGSDETLVISDGQLPRDFVPAPLWQVRAGGFRLSALPGFLDEHTEPLVGLTRANNGLKLRVAGRYPSPIDVGG